MTLRRSLLLLLVFTGLYQASAQVSVSVSTSRPKITYHRMTSGTYSVLDEDPEGLPQLFLGGGIHLNISPGAYDIFDDQPYGLNFAGSYRLPEFGEVYGNFSKQVDLFGLSDMDPSFAPNHTEIEGGLMKYIKTYEKQAAERIDLTSFNTYSRIVQVYMAMKVPATISYGPRLGFISRNSRNIMLDENISMSKANQGTFYLGFGRTKRVREVINFTKIGVRNSNRTVNYYFDVMFAPMQKEKTVLMSTVEDPNTGDLLNVQNTYHPAKSPLGFRMGLTRYEGNLSGKFGIGSTMELGWRPTFGGFNKGLYFSYSYRIMFGLMGSAKHIEKGPRIKAKDSYYNYDWYAREYQAARDKRKRKEGPDKGQPIRIGAGASAEDQERARNLEKSESSTASEDNDDNESVSKSSKESKSKKAPTKKSNKKKKKKAAASKKKKARSAKKLRKKTTKYKRRSFFGQLIHGKNSKKTLQKSRFG